MEILSLLGPAETLVEPEPFGLWRFRVDGEAVPQGSMKATLNRHTGRVVLFPSNAKALKAWREAVELEARCTRPPWLGEPWDGPVALDLVYVRERPASDYLSDGVTLSKSARRFPSVKPDVDKCDRAILDALSAIAYTDDGRVVRCNSAKRYGAPGERGHVLLDVTFLR